MYLGFENDDCKKTNHFFDFLYTIFMGNLSTAAYFLFTLITQGQKKLIAKNELTFLDFSLHYIGGQFNYFCLLFVYTYYLESKKADDKKILYFSHKLTAETGSRALKAQTKALTSKL